MVRIAAPVRARVAAKPRATAAAGKAVPSLPVARSAAPISTGSDWEEF
jgi:hypothetical protein